MPASINSSPATTSSSLSASATDSMHVFVTVGSTRFDALVQKVLSDPVLDVLHAKGYRTLDIQCGNSDFDASHLSRDADEHWQRTGHLDTSVWRFKSSLQEDYKRADLVISHAGSGTIIDVLRLRKPLIVIPNETLLDNHQAELSGALEGLGHLRSSTVADLPHAIHDLDASTLVPFPQFEGSRFRELLDEEMGYPSPSHSRETSQVRR